MKERLQADIVGGVLMISIEQLNTENNILTCNILGLAENLSYRTSEVKNGINRLSFSDMPGICSALLRLDDLEIKNKENSYLFNKKNYSYVLSNNEIKEFKYQPLAHQIEAINYALKHRSLLLLDSMGLGPSVRLWKRCI